MLDRWSAKTFRSLALASRAQYEALAGQANDFEFEKRGVLNELRDVISRFPAFDFVLSGASPFQDLPEAMSQLAAGSLPALCHGIVYEGERGVQRDGA